MKEQSNNAMLCKPQIEVGLTVPFRNETSYLLSESEISLSHKLADTVRKIHNELLYEGYTIIDGRVYFEGKQVFERVTKPQMFWHKKSQVKQV
jgi:hypothetical protein